MIFLLLTLRHMRPHLIHDDNRDWTHYAVTLMCVVMWSAILAVVIVFVMFVAMSQTRAHDWHHHDFAQATPTQRNWLNKQRRPGTTFTCCNESDGEQVDEEIRYDHKGIARYWINSKHTRGQWMQVPEEAVIREPNLHGRPIAWFRWAAPDGSFTTFPRADLRPEIFCYVPGPLV